MTESARLAVSGSIAGAILIVLGGTLALFMMLMTPPNIPGPVVLPVTTAPGSGYADVMTFGAVGDGEHDDTDAFEAALATGLPVFVPASGEGFLITRTLRLHNGQSLLGMGGYISRLLCRTRGACLANNDQAHGKQHGLTVRDIGLFGAGNAATDGIVFVRTNGANIENVLIQEIGGVALAIDGVSENGTRQSHYAYIANVRIRGEHTFGLQFRGRGDGEGSNRHRIFFVHINGSTEAAVDIWRQSGTIGFYGLAVENVAEIARIAGRNNIFFGLNAETVHGDGVTFADTASGNRFVAARFSKVNGVLWVNPELNETTSDPDAPWFEIN